MAKLGFGRKRNPYPRHPGYLVPVETEEVREELPLASESERIASLVRILGASVNVDILRVLMEARRREPDGGWLYLSEISEALGENPGTVGAAIQKLTPLLEEKRERGRRYFRSRVTDFEIHLSHFPQRTLL